MSINDKLASDLEGLGFTGALPDMMFRHLRSLGYTGTLSEMLYQAGGFRKYAKMSVSFSPSSLFGNSERGAWYNMADGTSLYQDSAGTTPVLASGDLVGLVKDLSGNSNDAVQGIDVNRPEYVGTGLKCVVDQYLDYDGSFFVGGPFTILARASTKLPADEEYILGGSSRVDNGNLQFGWRDSTTYTLGYYYNDLNAAPMSYTSGQTIILGGIQSPSGRSIRQDGAEVGADTNTTYLVSYDTPRIGNFRGRTFEGEIEELIMIDRVLTSTELTKAEAYLTNETGDIDVY